jgi:hypothetical protein
MGHSWESSGVFRSLHPFSLPRALNDSFPPRVFAGRMSQSGRSETITRHLPASFEAAFFGNLYRFSTAQIPHDAK